MSLSETQIDQLKEFRTRLRRIAQQVGSMHAYWDLIFDIEAVLEGKQGVISDPDELIRMAKDCLSNG